MKQRIRTRLIEARKYRQLTQKELADLLGTTQNNVSRWELGITTPTPYYRAKLCNFLDKQPQELDLLGNWRIEEQPREDVSRPASPVSAHSEQNGAYWHIPHPRNPLFTGRDHLLESLHEALAQKNGTIALTQSYALNGLGGIGKTQVALEYAYRYMNCYTTIFWIHAETYSTLLASFNSIASVINLPEKNEQDQQKIIHAVLHWLNERQRWLLIFDNVEDLSLLQTFFPHSQQGALLLTTRLQALGSFAHQIAMTPLNPEDALTLLGQRAKLLRPQMSPLNLAPADLRAASQIVEEMDGLPLAIDQAGAYIEETQCSLTDYLERYQQRRALLLGRRGFNHQDYPASVKGTLSLSFQQVEQKSPSAAKVLQLCAFLAPDTIPEEILLRVFSANDEQNSKQTTDAWLLDEAIAVLGTYSLLYRDSATRTLHIHRLVQAVLQDSLPEQEQEVWIQRVIGILNRIFPDIEQGTWNRCERLLPHVLRYARYAPSSTQVCHELASLLIRTGRYLTERCYYAEAESLLQQALHLLQVVFGKNHPEVAICLNALGELYLDQQQFSQAECHLQKAYVICQQTLDKSHPAVAANLNALGLFHHMQGEYPQAEKFYRQTLEVRQQILEPGHLDMAESLNNLAYLFYNQKRYQEAEEFFQQALAIQKKALQPTHFYIAMTKINLGTLYVYTSKFDEAEIILREASATIEQTFGTESAHTASSFNSLGQLYQKQKRYEEAISFYTQALKIREKILGLSHSRTLQPLILLAKLHQELGQYAQAEVLYQKVLPLIKTQEAIKIQEAEELLSFLEAAMNDYKELLIATHRADEAEMLPDSLAHLLAER